jgi:hypothetical protein
VFWQSGSFRLSIGPIIELKSLVPNDCRQTSVHLADESGSGPETHELTAFSADAGVEVKIGNRPAEASASVGTTLELGVADVAGRSVTQLTVERGSLHSLAGEISRKWIIDNVETIPSEALREWYVDQRESGRSIEVQLVDAARIDRPMTIIVTGRWQLQSLTEPLAMKDLPIIHWRDVKIAHSFLMAQSIDPYIVEPLGDLRAVALDSLTEKHRALFPSEAEVQLFDLSSPSDSAVRLATKRAQYESEILLDATFDSNELRQTYRLECRPSVSPTIVSDWAARLMMENSGNCA